MTEEQLQSIRARAAAATPGPWQPIQPGGPNGPFWSICNPQGNVVALRLSQSPHDADFIAHAREDVTALLDEVERLRETLASVEWADMELCCPWCQRFIDHGHQNDCPRQAALGR